MRGGSDIRKAYRAIAALAVTVVAVAAVTVILRATYGFFSTDIKVSGEFPRASQALKKGSDVKYLGVTVGRVKSISLLANHHVRITLTLSKSKKIPADVEAVIAPNTFFGDKFVDLEVQGDHHGGPWLTDGSTLAKTNSGREVEQLIDSADSLLGSVNTTDLTTLLTELTRFSKGEGSKIAANLEVGVKAASSFNNTLDAQLNALDALARFQSAVKGLGPDLNAIAGDLNVALPVFNQARGAFASALDTLRPFADNLASLISVNRPSLDRIFANGDNISRVVLAQRQQIGDTIYGLSRYVYKFGSGASADTLADGSKFAYFKQIADFKDIANLVCGVIAPPQPALPASVATLQQQLVGLLSSVSGGKIDCSAYANPGGTKPATGSTPLQTIAPPASTSSSGTATYSDKVYGALGTPDHSTPGSLQTFLTQLLGGGS